MPEPENWEPVICRNEKLAGVPISHRLDGDWAELRMRVPAMRRVQ
jgi:hypothetical protein